MDRERKMISVDQVGNDTILIYLADESIVHITLDQLLSSGIPRYPVPPDEEGLQTAFKNVLDRTPKN